MLMEESVKEFAAELRVLSKLHHANIVPFYGMYKAPGDGQTRYLLVTKFAVRVARRVGNCLRSPCGRHRSSHHFVFDVRLWRRTCIGPGCIMPAFRSLDCSHQMSCRVACRREDTWVRPSRRLTSILRTESSGCETWHRAWATCTPTALCIAT
jgi:hypothetical protein